MRKKLLTAVLAMLITAGLLFAVLYTPIRKSRYPLKYEDIIQSCSEKYDLPPELIASMIYCESSFREEVVSHAGAYGLMQLTQDTYDWITWHMGDEFTGGSITDPETNINCGCYFMRYLLDKFGSTETALAGYNAGYGAVSNWLKDERYSDDGSHLKDIPYAETKNYVKKVMNVAEIYKELYYREH